VGAARRSVLAAGARAGPAGVVPFALDAGEFALGAGKINVMTASAPPVLRVSSAAPAVGTTAEATGESVARAFLSYLFRRGRVDLGAHGDAETRVAHARARKTHELVKRGGEMAVVRRTFDCGFDGT